MKYLLATFFPIASMAFMIAPVIESNFSSCLPSNEVGFSMPAIVFDEMGRTKINATSELVIGHRKTDGIEHIDFWTQKAVFKNGSVDFKKFRSKMEIHREFGKPLRTITKYKVEGVEKVNQRLYEYNDKGRCRVAKDISFEVKDGKPVNAIVTADAQLCDKVIEAGNKNPAAAKQLSMCAGAFSIVEKAITSHVAAYQDTPVYVASKPTKITPKLGTFNPYTGKAVTVDAQSTQAILGLMAQCQFLGGVGAMEPIYGKGFHSAEATGSTPNLNPLENQQGNQ